MLGASKTLSKDLAFTCRWNWGAAAICHVTLKSIKRFFVVICL